MVLAILNGALRVRTYGKHMPEFRAHQLSTLTGILLIALAVYCMHLIWPLESAKQALTVGAVWFLMTLGFEFGFGHYIMKNSWKKLFAYYRIDKGRVWILFLIWTAIAPYVIYTVY